ncbi:MAG: 1-deoxy-D-xylulose-5-phosphate synthase [Pseudomonadota bacterium]
MKNKQDKESVLARVNSPKDIRELDIPSLNRLAGEIREMIIETVSRSGGHLASSLGAVELTLAIHKVFETPRDKLVWDVGHQAYAHKIITGRKDRFHTLRQKGGLSGFPKRAESPYDCLDVGHSSTSISAATGMAEARCLKGEDYKIIVVIGDGSMTAGMAYEGLNWAGNRKKDIIIILNDNEMSISANVGAMSSYLNRIMTGQTMTRLKAEIKHFLSTIPSIGGQMVRLTQHVEESLKTLIVPGALFEDLGFTYVGPLEGHRLDHLIKNLENVRAMEGPVLVHALTKKGKGYLFAEKDPSRFHGIAPFCVETGAADADQAPTYTQVFGRTLVRLARENPKIVAITAAMCDGTGLGQFARELPERFFDVGIAEQHGVTFAAGLALEGFIPVTAIYSTFMQRAYDQVLHDVCMQNLPVVLALDRGGFVGDDGPTHHGLFDLSYLRAIPNMIVMAPKDENEFQHMLKTAVDCGRPVSIRYPRGMGVGAVMDETISPLAIGRAEVVCEGTDIGILAIGSTVYPALAAADKLRREGIHARVVNARFVKPLDGDLLGETARSLKRIITVEENVLMGGFGSAVLELFEQIGIYDVQVKRLGIPDEFIAHATQAELRSQHGIDETGIIRAARNILEGHQSQAG